MCIQVNQTNTLKCYTFKAFGEMDELWRDFEAKTTSFDATHLSTVVLFFENFETKYKFVVNCSCQIFDGFSKHWFLLFGEFTKVGRIVENKNAQ